MRRLGALDAAFSALEIERRRGDLARSLRFSRRWRPRSGAEARRTRREFISASDQVLATFSKLPESG